MFLASWCVSGTPERGSPHDQNQKSLRREKKCGAMDPSEWTRARGANRKQTTPWAPDKPCESMHPCDAHSTKRCASPATMACMEVAEAMGYATNAHFPATVVYSATVHPSSPRWREKIELITMPHHGVCGQRGYRWPGVPTLWSAVMTMRILCMRMAVPSATKHNECAMNAHTK